MPSNPPSRLHRLSRRPASERGFTLIELLVVIIILGVLAAVVVFAVRGVGDKGKSNAVTIDERTIRTAEEAYCAKFGQYGNGADLIREGFLSELPEYHNVAAQKTGGNCNGWAYSILQTAAAGVDPGTWEATSDAPTGNAGHSVDAKRLPDGRVLYFYFSETGDYGTYPDAKLSGAVWDPLTGQWTVMDSHSADMGQVNILSSGILADDPATGENECGSNCGKALMRLHGAGDPADPAYQPWYLFNPHGAAGSQWEQLTSNEAGSRAPYSGMYPPLQLRDDPSAPGSQCGANCGKVLVTGAEMANLELYDPRQTGPAAWQSVEPGVDMTYYAHKTVLPSGKILLVGAYGPEHSPSKLLDPATMELSPAGDTMTWHGGTFEINLPILPSGEVFAYSAALAHTEIYMPGVSGPGTWRSVLSGCPTSGSAPQCILLGSMPDGRVLATSSSGQRSNFLTTGQDGKAWVFDVNAGTGGQWTPTADLIHPASTFGVSLDRRTGPCGNYCDKFLVVGWGPGATALYTP